MKIKYYCHKLTKIAALFTLLLSAAGGLAQTPGGLTGATYDLWYQADNYTSGNWTNSISGKSQWDLVPASTTPTSSSGIAFFNFHRAINFAATTLLTGGRFVSAATTGVYNIDRAYAYHFFIVSNYNPYGTTYDETLINLYGTYGYYCISWESNVNNTSQLFSHYWTSTERPATSLTVANGCKPRGIIATSMKNTATTDGFRLLLNGRASTHTATTTNAQSPATATSGRISVGSAAPGSQSYPFSGDIYEIIVLRTAAGSMLSDNDLQKVNTYLAIKYGYMLDNTSSWPNSSGTAVWDYSQTSSGTYHHRAPLKIKSTKKSVIIF
jgi:hypothetical protein